jgi:hypothetical protein
VTGCVTVNLYILWSPNTAVFWDVTPWCLVYPYERSRRFCYLHLEDRR